MRVYYCDICENEIENELVKVGGLDFNRGNLELCGSCYSKFKSAKDSLHYEYEIAYKGLDEDYINDLKEIILAEPDPEPDPEENEGGTGHRPSTDEEVGA